MRNLFELLVPKSIKKVVKRIAVCFIDRDKILFVSFPDKVVKEFDFPPSAVSDADVVNKEDYRAAVFEWVRDNSPKVSDIIFVASEHMVFTKDFRPSSKMRPPSQETLSSFVEVVPFQRVYISKTVSKDGSIKMIVTNRDIVSVVVRAFENNGFVSLGVFPEFATLSSSADAITPQNFVDQARKHADLLTLHPYTQSAFNTSLEQQQKPITQMSVSEAAKQPINPAVAVIIVLVMVGGAIYFIYWRFEQVRASEIEATKKRIELIAAKQRKPTGTKTDIVPVVATKETITATISASITPIQVVSKARIQIIYADSSMRLYELVKSSIVATYGYEVVGELSSVTPDENRLLIGEKTSDSTVQNIKGVLSSANVNLALSSKANVEGFDMVLTLGKISPEAQKPAPQ